LDELHLTPSSAVVFVLDTLHNNDDGNVFIAISMRRRGHTDKDRQQDRHHCTSLRPDDVPHACRLVPKNADWTASQPHSALAVIPAMLCEDHRGNVPDNDHATLPVIDNKGVEQTSRFHKVDEERQLPKRRECGLAVPLDTDRPSETVEANARRQAFVFNRRWVTSGR
jgi:hypothetical protein